MFVVQAYCSIYNIAFQNKKYDREFTSSLQKLFVDTCKMYKLLMTQLLQIPALCILVPALSQI